MYEQPLPSGSQKSSTPERWAPRCIWAERPARLFSSHWPSPAAMLTCVCLSATYSIRGMQFTLKGRLFTPDFQTPRCSRPVRASDLRPFHQRIAIKFITLNSSSVGPSSFSVRRRVATPPLAASKSSAVSPPEIAEEGRPPRLAVFVSGGGSNFRAIHAGILNGQISAEVAVSSTRLLSKHRTKEHLGLHKHSSTCRRRDF